MFIIDGTCSVYLKKSSTLRDFLVREYVGMTTTFLLNGLKYFDTFWYSYRFVIICVQISIDFET